MHWPGRLRPPFEPFEFPAGMRRCGVTLVFCASSPAPPGERSVAVTGGRAADAKTYGAASPPLGLWELGLEPAGVVGRVAGASLALVVRPGAISAPRGAYVVVLEADAGSAHHACDLFYVEPGASVDGAGIARALVMTGDARDVEAPPPSWDAVAAAPMARIEAAPRGELPFARHGVVADALDATRVTIAVEPASTVVPRHWLARMLYRIALHAPALGYVETYGGFFYDDREVRDGVVRFGVRAAGGSRDVRIRLRPRPRSSRRCTAPSRRRGTRSCEAAQRPAGRLSAIFAVRAIDVMSNRA